MNSKNMYVYTSVSEHVIPMAIDQVKNNTLNGVSHYQNDSQRGSWGGGSILDV